MFRKIRNYLSGQDESLWLGVLKGTVWVYLFGVSLFYVLVFLNIPTQNGDNIEHIHSSFLVATGEVPYRDFFQHHNPLLWYLMAPVVRLFAYNSTVIEVVCFVSFMVFLKSLVYVFRISEEFLSDRFWGIMTVAMVACPGYKIYAVDFRPDNYMIFCLMGGIYYYFCYLQDKKTKALVGAFAWFFVGFMFAQKALFPLLFLGGTVLYFWYQKEIRTPDLGKALIFPLAGAGVFLAYLWHYDMVELYFVSNYVFNLNLVPGFDFTKVVEFPVYMLVVMWLGWGGAVCALFSKNKYLAIVAFLFVGEFLQRRFYFSPYSYYYWLLLYLAALCAGAFLCKFDGWRGIVGTAGIILLCLSFYQTSSYYYKVYQAGKGRAYLPDYIARKISPCDYVFNGDGMMYNLFGKDPAYYWQLIGQLDVIGKKTGLPSMPDMNMLIKKFRPKFVFGESYFNKFSEESGRKEIVHYIDKNLIDTYYERTNFDPVYQLKPAYNKRVCKKDPVSGEWRFVE